jgi:poly-gamma-glutamate synthesis protein (capsule biosynthesis protein)
MDSRSNNTTPHEVTVSIVGDFCPVHRVENAVLENHYDAFKDAREALSKRDLVIANIECPLTSVRQGIKKTGPNLKAQPRAAELLKFLNVNIAALANNHILDYGEHGLNETLNVLNDNSINCVGAGSNLEEARKPLMKTVNDTRICIMNVCEREFSVAGENSAGANPFDIIAVMQEIDKYRKHSDFLIMLYHGGIESYGLPTPEMYRRFVFLAGRGLDVIVCNHQHVFSGYQKIGNCHIFFGLGNFIFDWPSIRNNPWNYGIILNLTITGKKLKEFRLIPYEQCNGELGLKMSRDIEERILHEIEVINPNLNNAFLNKEWLRYVTRNRAQLMSDLSVQNRYLRFILKRSGLINFLVRRHHQRRLYNYFNCSSLSEYARDSLKYGLEIWT